MKFKAKAADFLIYDEATGKYRENPEQLVRDDVEKRHWRRVFQLILRDWRLYLMLVPMLFVFICWRYLPMTELLGCFKVGASALEVKDQTFAGFSNFKTLFFPNDTSTYAVDFWRAFRNTFMISFYGLCFGFPMPIIIALFFNEIKSNILRSVYQVFTYLPKFMSTVVITTLVTLLLKKGDTTFSNGIITQLFVNLGWIKDGTGMLEEPTYFRAIYQISGIWETAGYDSIVFFAAVIAVSPTSYEAAQIDGAGKMAQMRYVVLPSILSTVVIMLITKIGTLLSVGYEKVLLLYNEHTYQTAEVVSTFAHRFGIGDASNMAASSYAIAAEMVNNVIGMVLVIGANTIAKKAADVSLY